MRNLSLLVLACALAAACSSGGGEPDGGTTDTPDASQITPKPDAGEPDAGPPDPPDAGPPTLDVFVSPEIDVRQGTTVDLPLTLAFDVGRTGPATLSVTGTGDDLVATPDPVSVDGRFAPVVHLRAAADATASTRKITIKAVAGELTKSAEVDVHLLAFDGLDGTVVDQQGQPFRSVLVRVGAQTTLSDESGRFGFEHVTPPYDLDLVVGDQRRAYRFQQLSRRDPQVQLAGVRPVTNAWAFEGTFNGGFLPPPSDAAFWFALDAARARPKARAVAVTGSAYANTKFDFSGAPSTSGRLWAAEAKLDAERTHVVGYYAFGEQPVAPVAGQRVPGMGFHLNPVETATIAGNITVPEGFQLTKVRTWLSRGGAAGFSLRLKEDGDSDGHTADSDVDDVLDDDEHIPADHPSSNRFVYPVPAVDGFHLSLVATATKDRQLVQARKIGLVRGQGEATLALPNAPTITSPEAADTAMPRDASFTWTDGADRVYVVAWGSGAAGDPLVTVVTTAKSATVPDFASLGVSLPDGAPLTFTVMAVEPYATVDDAASTQGLRYGSLLPTKSGRGDERDGATALDRLPFQFAAPPPP